jgi:methionyl-tRNA formyltransferase
VKILLAGQKWFGAAVLAAMPPTVTVTHVCAPYGDRLDAAARATGVPVIESGTLNADTMPEGIDLIVAAHSHDFLGERTRLRARYGAIGYHPSLLPLHRGRDAVAWAVRMGDRVTGGTVYRLNNTVDGGPIIDQRHVFIRHDDDPATLWRRDLAPLGVDMLRDAVIAIRDAGRVKSVDQDEALATWEPSIGRAPIRRPDLILLAPPMTQAAP